jgi:hypothetical protein
MIACILFSAFNKNSECDEPIKMWLGVFAGGYLSENIVIMY